MIFKNNMNKDYIFESQRLGFRNWKKTDLNEFAEINADIDVMEHFPNILTKKETSDFMDRLQKHFENKGYTYFATDILETKEFIGFIGLAYQDYKTDFTPATDIGWRLKKSAWGKGYATEGAKKCIEYAFQNLNLNYIISACTEKNFKSEQVMKKIGMEKLGEFKHPKLIEFPEYEKCLCYGISKNSHIQQQAE